MVTTTEVLGYGGQVYTRDKRSRNWRHNNNNNNSADNF